MPAKVVLGILLLGTVSALAQLQSLDATGVIPDPPAADIALPVKLHGDPLRLIGGFASVPGSFAGLQNRPAFGPAKQRVATSQRRPEGRRQPERLAPPGCSTGTPASDARQSST